MSISSLSRFGWNKQGEKRFRENRSMVFAVKRQNPQRLFREPTHHNDLIVVLRDFDILSHNFLLSKVHSLIL